MLVKIKPIDIERWHGKVGKDSFSQPIKLRALYDQKTGKYATGLTKEKRKELEAQTGFDLSDNFNPITPHPFWDSSAAVLELPNNTIFLRTSIPLDEIKFYIAKASRFVANSLKDYEDGLFPDATHVIFDEEEDVKLKAKKVEIKKTAFKVALKLSKPAKLDLIMILAGKNLKKQSDEYIEVELDNLLETSPDKFLEYAGKDKKYIAIKSLILQAIDSRVLSKRGDSIFYMDELLGATIEDAITYLEDPKSQNMKIAIMEKLV